MPGIDWLYQFTNNLTALTTANGDACLSKPYSSTDLLRGLQIVAEIVANGNASSSFPKGFQVLRPASPVVAA